ncbi:hypothetical protein JRQ81_001389 [Phrynocephalus forsythii]|uniref:T-cell-specific surface glycoprotein CD28 n=1 Tax=Phrynocephalus forsythii TaxID=171643 RepID=A0A9Q0Y732_9SAUR|nr:hypothetical protein JRQ81_001389 [Phrynocephalus forsythii]
MNRKKGLGKNFFNFLPVVKGQSSGSSATAMCPKQTEKDLQFQPLRLLENSHFPRSTGVFAGKMTQGEFFSASPAFWSLLPALIIQIARSTAISVHQTPLHAVVNQNAEISCTYAYEKEVKEFNIWLLKGVPERVSVCSFKCSTTCTMKNSTVGFNCRVTKKAKGVTFHLQKLCTGQTDVYICKIGVALPPPYMDSESNNGTFINVTGVSEAPKCQCPERGSEYVGMTAIIGGLVLYGVAITVAFYYCWVKSKKRKIARNDYFNMTPWHLNGARKKHPPAVPARNYTAYRSWEP